MFALGNPKNGGIPRLSTKLEPVIRNKTRWSSENQMIKRFEQSRTFVRQENLPEVFSLMPSNLELVTLTEKAKIMADFKDVVKYLQGINPNKYDQGEKITKLDSRLLFDQLVNDHPSFVSKLNATASIVKNKNFENRLVKLLQGKESDLNLSEKEQLKGFLKGSQTSSTRNEVVAPLSWNLMSRCAGTDGIRLKHIAWATDSLAIYFCTSKTDHQVQITKNQLLFDSTNFP